ncbi:MAG: hypothetical protein K2Q06_09190 [Parvularculaceae bacterium]|nr:hypothetical protein [Parvularculaceae bacterium]
MVEKTRTLLFGLFVLAGRPLTAAQCAALAAPFGVSSSNVKSHLTRLVGEGALVRRGPNREGRYAIADAKSAVVDAIDLRLAPSDDQPWSGDWILLSAPAPPDRADRDHFAAALWFDGFRATGGGAFVRPDWPQPWASESAALFVALGGVAVIGRMSGVSAQDIAALYDLDDLDESAAALARGLGERRRATSPMSAFRNRVEAGGDVARFVACDPRLPPELWGRRTGMKRLRDAWRAFEKATAPLADAFVRDTLGSSDA